MIALTAVLSFPLFADALTGNGIGTNSTDKLEKLLNQRREVLSQRLTILQQQHDHGETQITAVLLAHDQLLEAELELAKNKQQRLNTLQKRIDVMKKMEQMAKQRFNSGVGSNEALLAAKAARLKSEIDLAREEK